MRKINYLYIVSLVIAGILVLDLIWIGIFAEDFAGKALATLVVVNLLAFFGDMIIRDNKEEKQMKKDGYID